MSKEDADPIHRTASLTEAPQADHRRITFCFFHIFIFCLDNNFFRFSGIPFQMIGVIHVIVKTKNGEILAPADHRRGGAPAGYR